MLITEMSDAPRENMFNNEHITAKNTLQNKNYLFRYYNLIKYNL